MTTSFLRSLAAFAVLGVVLSAHLQAKALEPVAWQTDFETARQMAVQSNRLLLLHFWSPECGPCRALESKVFNQPGFAQGVSVHYVPVKVNIYDQPGLAHAFKVSQYPTEVVVGPDGKEITRFRAPMNAASYLATATQIARANPAVVKPFVGGASVAPGVAAQQPNFSPVPAQQLQAQDSAMAPTAGVVGVQTAAATAPIGPQMNQPASGEIAPLGLDGYCPVRLCENRAWVKGNSQYGVTHRGRLYLFAGPDEVQKFWQNPDRYSPVAGGEDPVVAVDQGMRVSGKREFGLYLGHRVYLFSSEETLQRFKQNTSHYSEIVLQAERPTTRY